MKFVYNLLHFIFSRSLICSVFCDGQKNPSDVSVAGSDWIIWPKVNTDIPALRTHSILNQNEIEMFLGYFISLALLLVRFGCGIATVHGLAKGQFNL